MCILILTFIEKKIKYFYYYVNITFFDLYGFGQSVDPKPFFDIYEYAIQIYLFLQSKNINKVEILAHSFGGRIAIILSSIFEINVTKLILTGCAGIKPKYNCVYYFKVFLYKLKKRFYKTQYIGKFGSNDYRSSNNIMKRILTKVVNQHLDYLINYIQARCLLIWGGKDKDTPVYMLKKLKKQIMCCKVIVINKASHFCIFTHSYLCKNKISEFLIER